MSNNKSTWLKDKMILKRVSDEQEVVIKPVDGTMSIAQAKNVFKEGISRYFKKRGINKPSGATPESLIEIYELTADATLAQIFESLKPPEDTNLDGLCFTQHQIVQFCSQYPFHIRTKGYRTNVGHTTFFLFKVMGEYRVAYVANYLGDLDVNASYFEDPHPCLSIYSSRYVVPTKQNPNL